MRRFSGEGRVALPGSLVLNLTTANADGREAPAALALRVHEDGSQVYEPVARFDAGLNRYLPAPIDLTNNADKVCLVLSGTGLRHRSSLANVSASIGGEEVEVLFAGAQQQFTGMNQINLRLPLNLAGRGEVDLVIRVDGRTINTLRINVQ